MSRRLAPSAMLAAISVAAVVACSESNAPAPVVCSITFSGAFTNVSTCSSKPMGTYTTSSDTVIIQGGSNLDPTLSINVRFKGIPVTGTYANTDVGRIGFVSATDPTGSTGYIAASNFPGQANTGTWSLIITSVTEDSTTATGKKYTIHGSVNATMTPFGAVGNSVVTVTFQVGTRQLRCATCSAVSPRPSTGRGSAS